MITTGQSKNIFLCINPFSIWWQPFYLPNKQLGDPRGRPQPNNVKAFASAFVNRGGDLEDLANFADPAEEGVCSIIRLGSFEILKKYVCSCFKLIGACLPSKQWVYMGKYKSELACQGPTGIKLWVFIPWWNWRLNIFAESFLWGSESRALAWLRLWLRRAETSFNVSTSSQEPLLSLCLPS